MRTKIVYAIYVLVSMLLTAIYESFFGGVRRNIKNYMA